MVYSIDNMTSFNALNNHVELIKAKHEHPVMVMAGNKCDLEEQRAVATDVAKQKAAEWNAPFFETSAQSDINVTELFEAIARELVKGQTGAAKVENKPAEPTAAAAASTTSNDTKKEEKEGGCHCVLL